MRPSEFIRKIKKRGFKLHRHGTNHDFYSDNKGNMVMVERHNKEIDPTTLNRMLKDAGLK